MLKKILNAIASHRWDAKDLAIWSQCYSQPATTVDLEKRLGGSAGDYYARLHRLEKFGYLKISESTVSLEDRGGFTRYLYNAIGGRPGQGRRLWLGRRTTPDKHNQQKQRRGNTWALLLLFPIQAPQRPLAPAPAAAMTAAAATARRRPEWPRGCLGWWRAGRGRKAGGGFGGVAQIRSWLFVEIGQLGTTAHALH